LPCQYVVFHINPLSFDIAWTINRQSSFQLKKSLIKILKPLLPANCFQLIHILLQISLGNDLGTPMHSCVSIILSTALFSLSCFARVREGFQRSCSSRRTPDMKQREYPLLSRDPSFSQSALSPALPQHDLFHTYHRSYRSPLVRSHTP